MQFERFSWLGDKLQSFVKLSKVNAHCCIAWTTREIRSRELAIGIAELLDADWLRKSVHLFFLDVMNVSLFASSTFTALDDLVLKTPYQLG